MILALGLPKRVWNEFSNCFEKYNSACYIRGRAYFVEDHLEMGRIENLGSLFDRRDERRVHNRMTRRPA